MNRNYHEGWRDERAGEKKEHEDYKQEEIDLRELIEVLLRRKWAIATLIAVAVIAAGFFTMFVQREEYVSTVVEMNFEEVEQGEYPGGDSFDPRDMISPFVLSKVVEELELDDKHEIDVQDLREMIEVSELYFPVDDEEEDPEPAYQYRVSIHGGDGDTETLELNEKRWIISAVVENYRREYACEFIEQPLFPRLSEEAGDVLQFDYPFMNRNIEAYLEMFMDHLGEMSEATEEFYSARHGRSFGDLSRSVERIKQTRYADLSAVIRTNSLSEDPEAAIRHYENMIEELKLSEEKKLKEAEYARDLLDKARPLRRGSLPEMFPSIIEEDDRNLAGEIFDKLYSDNFYPQLIQVSLEAADDAIDSGHEIRRLKNNIEQMKELEDIGGNAFNSDENPAGDTAVLQHQNLGEEELKKLKERVDKKAIRLVGELNELVNMNNDMMEEYYREKAEEGIRFAVMPYSDVESGNLQLNVALAAVLGLMVGVFGAFFHEFWTRSTPSEYRAQHMATRGDTKDGGFD